MTPYERPREHLPQILKERGLTAMGVEVGVCRGEFSEILLKDWPGFLWLVDAWAPLDDYEELYPHADNLKACTERLVAYRERVGMLVMPSLAAAETFSDESLDFVYLDANHRYSAVLEDLNAWYPKLRKGALFAGDDYGPIPEQPVDFGQGRTLFGVKRAVDEFALQRGHNVSIDLLANWEVSGYRARGWYFLK